ncbi:MAG TPA: LamG-like jellyroll fold domain-containing protein [Cryomorphaceae bacterium]|nr:LamG-like jellyroll fold domain-containing protein [Cryomorphaceae bacterium]
MWLSLLTSLVETGYAQTGPGGVGNSENNVLWLKPEGLFSSGSDRVSFWPDESGNFNHAFAEMGHAPFLEQGYSWPEKSVHFSAEDPGFLRIADDPSLDGMEAMTIFAVIKPTDDIGEQSVISKRDGQGDDEIFAYRLISEPNGVVAAEVKRTNNRLTAGEHMSESYYNIVAFRFDGNTNSGQLKIFKNGSERGNRNTPQTSSIPDVDTDLIIGALNSNSELPFRGNIAEVIKYNTALNSAEMVIVENYLASKYQIPAESNFTANLGSFHHDVCGIGRAQGQNKHEVSQGRSMLRGKAAGNLGAKRYVFWGHNGAPKGEVTADSLPQGIEARLKRTWKFVTERNVNDIHLAFHLDSFASSEPSALRLLVGTNGENFLDQTTILPGVVNGDYMEFNNVAISEGQLVTLGTTSTGIAPLPVSLIHFNAESQPNAVALSWATSSEINNDFFTVLRSTDPEGNWKTVLTEEGAGNSTSRIDYRVYDTNPLPGLSYYRLAQTDFDGSYEEFEIKSVNRKAQYQNFEIELFPNPADRDVYIYSDISLQGANIAVFDMQGGEMDVAIDQNDSHVQIEVSNLPFGVYIFRCSLEQRIISVPFMVER